MPLFIKNYLHIWSDIRLAMSGILSDAGYKKMTGLTGQ